MQKKYRVSLLILGTLIILNIFLIISYQSYLKKNEMNEDTIVVVKQGLSINFLERNQLNSKQDTYPISITNTTNQIIYYSISVDELLKEYKSSVTLTDKNNINMQITKLLSKATVLITSQIMIEPGTTHNYELVLNNLDDEEVQGIISIATEEKDNSFAQTIIKNNIINETKPTKIGAETATTHEGLMEMSDAFGTTYFFRGNIENNYVRFAGHLWRIVSINGDKTVKLVFNSTIENNSYNLFNQEITTDFKTSNIYSILTNWYEKNIKPFDEYINNHNFCIDDSIKSQEGDYIVYNIGSRLFTDYAPIMSCLGTESNSKIGLLTADEVVLAGATNNAFNESYYLYNNEITSSWWTMSLEDKYNNDMKYYTVSATGQINVGELSTESRGIRPVININKSTTVLGSGTINDPYYFTTS